MNYASFYCLCRKVILIYFTKLPEVYQRIHAYLRNIPCYFFQTTLSLVKYNIQFK